MNNKMTKKPLVFESTFDLRNRLIAIHKKDGVEGIKAYINEEFTCHRAIHLGGEKSKIFDAQLRYLNKNKPAATLMGFKNNPTVENSTLMMTLNLIEIEPKIQLLVRKEL